MFFVFDDDDQGAMVCSAMMFQVFLLDSGPICDFDGYLVF